MTTWARPLRVTPPFAAFVALMLTVAPVHADVGNDGVFQIDGDVLLGNGTGDDWQLLFTFPGGAPSGAGSATSRSYVTDPSPQSIFTGGGSKDQLNLNQWAWKNGSVPDKNDVTNAFAATYTDSSGNHRLYFGADRLANNGDAQIGFWFFQSVVKLASNGSFVDSSGNPATHEVGDILVLSNFTQGGTLTNIQVLVVTAVNADSSVSLQTLVAGSAGTTRACDPTGNACAATNGAATASLDPAYTPKFGSTSGQYPPVSFFEGGLNLSALGLGGECFPSFLVETRSSQSISATLQDFTLGAFQQCAAGITTEIHASADSLGVGSDLQGTTVPANTSIKDRAIVTGSVGFVTPTGTVTFQFFANATCAGSPSSIEGPFTLTQTTAPTSTTAGVAEADSAPRTPLPGSYSYNASYSGDANYPAAGPSGCEPITVSRFNSAINTAILRTSDGADVTNQVINLMNAASVAVQDQATVTGSGPTPTGTVTFMRFNNGNCSGTPASVENVLLDGTGKALSSVLALGPNALSYTVIYNGDSNYNASVVSKCEPVCAINFTTSQP
jgi:Bacterial Ig-like domain (group 3)